MSTIQRITVGVLFAFLALGTNAVSMAHFIWVGTEDGEVRVYFGESTTPDKAMFLAGIKKMKVWQSHGDHFHNVKFELVKANNGEDGWFKLGCKPGEPIIADCVYGLFERSEKKMLLHYTAKYATIDNLKNAGLSKKLKLEVVPSLVEGKVVLTVYFEGKPFKGATVRMETSANVETLPTNDNGQVILKKGFGKRVWIRANMSVKGAGKWNGKEYEKKAFYSTLVLDPTRTHQATQEKQVHSHDDHKEHGEENSEGPDKKEVKAVESRFADLPVGVTSFGAAVCDGSVYFFGGHCGEPHRYSKEGQNQGLYRHNLKSETGWEKVATSGGLQGLAMVSHGGKLYRLGGFRADNEVGEHADLHSVDEFAVFDPEVKGWRSLPSLPEPRSSFDACVMDGKVFIVGGWAMAGPGKKEWRKTAHYFDFDSPEKGWKQIANPPFVRRALSVAFQGGKIVCVGGMQEKGGPTKKTAIYDVQNDKWLKGPELPGGGRMEGFGTSSFHASGQVFTSTYGGNLYRLSKDLSKWEKVAELEDARFFHRLLSIDNDKIMIMGGSHMESGKVESIEVIQVK